MAFYTEQILEPSENVGELRAADRNQHVTWRRKGVVRAMTRKPSVRPQLALVSVAEWKAVEALQH